ncbi:MAG: ABC transporter ATP-binding protein [Spongiibacter sp.]
MSLLEVENLSLHIGALHALRGVSFSLDAGECRALVGESGCGKSLTAMSLLGLTPPGAVFHADAFTLAGEVLPAQGSPAWRRHRGADIAMIFQNPMTALNPTQTVGAQLAESFVLHRNLGRREAMTAAVALLERLAIPQPAQRAAQYPFEFSGGMLQRVMIAMAVACRPKLLIADEPTTALDVTVQAEVLTLLAELQREQGTALLFITHDLGVVAEIADSVTVMYAGESVESGSVAQTFNRTAHPYSAALRAAVPSLKQDRRPEGIAGSPPDLRREVTGCAFAPRCRQRMAICEDTVPEFQCGEGQRVRCWRWHPDHPLRWREAENG